MKAIILCAIIFSGVLALAASKYPPVDGPLAIQLYELETNLEPSPDTVDLYGGCHYSGTKEKLVMEMCEYPDGFINPPIRDVISKLIQEAGLPIVPMQGAPGEWVIGFHFRCTQSTAHCDLDTFESEFGK